MYKEVNGLKLSKFVSTLSRCSHPSTSQKELLFPKPLEKKIIFSIPVVPEICLPV